MAEHGVPLGRPGWEDVTVGVGDLIQARRNAQRADRVRRQHGHAGQPPHLPRHRAAPRRRPDRRPAARARRADLGLDPAPIALPAAYVAEHVTLGYASTVHAAQGRTVDTAHAVVGAGLDASGTYVALTRGRDRNTAYAVTRSLAPDTATGQTFEVHERTARAVLHDILDAAREDRTALTERERARLDAASTMTHVDQLIDGVAQVTAGRTAAVLDRLAAEGHLSAEHRAALVTDEAAGSLDRLLRLAELSGHDRDQVLTDAVAARSLDGATYPAQVLHTRITTALRGQLTPHITSAHDLIPPDLPPAWDDWLHDARRCRRPPAHRTWRPARRSSRRTGRSPPSDRFPTTTPTSRRPSERSGSARPAGRRRGASWPATPKNPPTSNAARHRARRRPGREARAVPHRARGPRPGRRRGRGSQHVQRSAPRPRARLRAGEGLGAPRRRRRAGHRPPARGEGERRRDTLGRPRRASVDPDEQRRLRDAAQAARQEADGLAEQIAALEEADEARAVWFTHTATTRDYADRGRSELRSRGVDIDHPTDRVTAEEWLDAHRIEQLAADADREIHDEHELLDLDLGVDLDDVRAELDAHATEQAETGPADVRDTETAAPE